MKKIIFKSVLLIGLLFTAVSCDEQLDIAPIGSLSDTNTFLRQSATFNKGLNSLPTLVLINRMTSFSIS